MCLRRRMTLSMGSSAGSSTRRATKSSSGSRRQDNNARRWWRLAAIDPKANYLVRWERFGEGRAVYTISQDGQKIFASTLATNAKEILVDVLHVKNYPCEEWPNLDI